MTALNWGMIQDGGAFESLTHAILYAEDPGTRGTGSRSSKGNSSKHGRHSTIREIASVGIWPRSAPAPSQIVYVRPLVPSTRSS